MENTLLYFYSTIPQVLAAIIALVIVLVFFKLQQFDKGDENLCSFFIHTFRNEDYYNSILARNFVVRYESKYFVQITDVMDEICMDVKNHYPSMFKKLTNIATESRQYDIKRRSIIKNAKNLSYFGFIVITGSILMIPIVNIISINCLIMNFLFVVFILVTAILLRLVYKLLSITLEDYIW